MMKLGLSLMMGSSVLGNANTPGNTVVRAYPKSK